MSDFEFIAVFMVLLGAAHFSAVQLCGKSAKLSYAVGWIAALGGGIISVVLALLVPVAAPLGPDLEKTLRLGGAFLLMYGVFLVVATMIVQRGKRR